MNILVLYQNVPSGSKVATASIVTAYRMLYPDDELTVYKQGVHKYLGAFPFLRNLIWSMWDFWLVLNRVSNVDLIYSAMYTYIPAYRFSNKRRIPVIFHVHGDQRFGPHHHGNPIRREYATFLGRCVEFLQKQAIKTARAVIFVTEKDRDIFLQQYNLQHLTEKSVIVPNGVNPTLFSPINQEERQRLRRALQCYTGWQIVYVGRIDEKKGVHLLIEALPFLKRPATLLVVHPRYFDSYSRRYMLRLRSLVKTLKRGKVRFVKNPTQIAQWYHIADCVALPSQQEMMPLVMLESLACGTLFLARNVGSVGNVLRRVSPLLILKHNNSKYLAHKISQVLTLPHARRESIILAGREAAIRFSWVNSAKLLRQTAERLIQLK